MAHKKGGQVGRVGRDRGVNRNLISCTPTCTSMLLSYPNTLFPKNSTNLNTKIIPHNSKEVYTYFQSRFTPR